MKLLLLVYRFLGRTGFLCLLYPVMCYYYLTCKEARLASKQYLQRIALLLPIEQRSSLSTFRHLLAFGEILLDKLLVWSGHIRREDVIFETPDTIAEIENRHQGGVIVVSHLGNFEVCSALANQVPDLRLTILVYTHHAKKFNAIMKRVNTNINVEIMQVTDVSPATAMLFSEKINAGGYVIIAGDRTPVSSHNRTSSVNFLNESASLPQGPFILAGLLRCPVYLLFCVKQQSKYHMYIELLAGVVNFTDRKGRLHTINNLVQQYADRLQHYCLQAPLQWSNFFPFWSSSQNLQSNRLAKPTANTGA